MAESIDFYSNTVAIGGSGIGFYGSSGFGSSVAVGEYQTSTYITNDNGTVQGAEINNVKYTHPNSGATGASSSSLHLLDIPNYKATLNVRFTSTSAVKTQNAQARIYDRSNINNNASGVTTKVAQIIHPDTSEAGQLGSGSTVWSTLNGSGVTLLLTASPGTSGLRPNGSNTTDTRHDWYLALSASPDSIGSKTQYGLWIQLEYL
jgi:hypothetical protein